ncbi:MAG: hypothetical protein KDC98_26425 [Planctomycetes bacterium]|nr:hypothetical protein [Planctomycetota bacterium]
MFTSAWWYYQRCTARNRLAALLRRLRQPKYLIGLVLTVAYFGWIFLWNPAFSGDETPDPAAGRTHAGIAITCYYALQVVIVWFSLSSGRGVAFREAEIQQLFPRPFTRWQILVFKWLTAQPGMLIGGLIVGLLLNRFGGLSYPHLVLGFWINQTALYANTNLVGLYLARLKARGGTAARLTSLPAWALLLALGAAASSAWSGVGEATGWAAAEAMLRAPGLVVVTWPFAKLAELMLASDLATTAAALVVPLALLIVQAWLVRWADFRFEDQAVDIAEKIQNIKSQGIGALQSKKDLVVGRSRLPWQLAPTGPAWKALVWKNVISLGRLPRRLVIRLGVIIVIVVAIIANTFVTIGDAPHVPTRIGIILLGMLAYGTLLAPSLVRVDLRIDIPHFDVLKAMPLRGRSVIFGEIMGSVVVLFAIQAIGCIVAALLIRREGGHEFGWGDKLPALLGLLAVFFAVDLVLLTGENLMALWLPGFVRLGRGMRAGFDQVGQNLMGALIRMLALFVLLTVPGIASALLGVLAYQLGLPLFPAIAVGAALFSAMVCAEAWLLIHLSEGRYQRFDISSENVSDESR